jgi:YHS domain-containing protein
MSIHKLPLAIALTATIVSGVATAQHEAHQAGVGQASPEMVQCGRVQPVIDAIITAAMARVETARLSNNPAEMRAAVDHLEAALRDIRAQLAPCSAAAAATDPHAGHAATPARPAPVQPVVPGAKAKPTEKPAAPDPHAGHSGTAAKPGDPGAKGAAGASKAAPKTKPSTPSDPHAGHGTTGKPAAEVKDGKVMDPVTGLMVDPATAPKTTYQGQTYYFSSEQSRKEFLTNPAKFAKKPKG